MTDKCLDCDGSGVIWSDRCFCDSMPHEPYCGAEPCPSDCRGMSEVYDDDDDDSAVTRSGGMTT
jgi:hypothetical protein